jgi:hypothetical protein
MSIRADKNYMPGKNIRPGIRARSFRRLVAGRISRLFSESVFLPAAMLWSAVKGRIFAIFYVNSSAAPLSTIALFNAANPPKTLLVRFGPALAG